MVKNIRWLIPAVYILTFVIQPCYALELIISDSGRNTAWSENLKIGDDFSVKGADGKPIGGIIAHTTAIHQTLVPMPEETELEEMSQVQEKLWIKRVGELLKDRVHIATTNGATIFEIRLLQNTPQPSAATMPWQENSHTDRFARIAYQAVGVLVAHLQERKEPIRITAALADSGCEAFAQGIDNWKPYADTFRRADLVDGRASLTEIRPVIATLGDKRVRLFHTTGIPTAPAMTIGRREVADTLLKSHQSLNLYTLTSTEPKRGDSDQNAQTPWMPNLVGNMPSRVERTKYIDNKIVNQKFDKIITGQDFRAPKLGWDPVNSDLHATESLKQLGIIASDSNQTPIPTLRGSIGSGFSLSELKSNNKEVPSLFAYVGDTKNNTIAMERATALSQATSDINQVLIVAGPTQKHTKNLVKKMQLNHDMSNLLVVSSGLNNQELQNEARRFGAAVIVGQNSNIKKSQAGKYYLVDHAIFDDTVKYIDHARKNIKALIDLKRPNSKLSKSKLFKIGKGLDQSYNFFRANEKDQKYFAGRKFNIWQSHKLVEGSKIAYDRLLTASSALSKMGKINNKLVTPIAFYDHLDVPEAASIVGKSIGQRSFSLDQLPKTAKWVGKRATYFAVYYRNRAQGHMIADTKASVAEAAVGYGLDKWDDSTKRYFETTNSSVSGKAADALEKYHAHAMERAIKGNNPPSLTEYVGGVNKLKRLGFNENAINSAEIYRHQLQNSVNVGRAHRTKQNITRSSNTKTIIPNMGASSATGSIITQKKSPGSTDSYLSNYNPSARISDKALNRIQSIPIFANRMDAYVDEWVKVHGKGPVVLMVRGVQHRLNEGEDYAQQNFPKHRMIVLPSYESIGVLGKKIDIKPLRMTEDVFRTLGDRAKLTRNMDLPKVWDRLADKGNPVIASAHESGAGHDLNKNMPYIIKAKKAGRDIPLIVPTSTNISKFEIDKAQKAGILIHKSVTHESDLVGVLTKNPKEVAPKWAKKIPVVNVIAGEVGKLAAPFRGKTLEKHAKMQNELRGVFDTSRNKFFEGGRMQSHSPVGKPPISYTRLTLPSNFSMKDLNNVLSRVSRKIHLRGPIKWDKHLSSKEFTHDPWSTKDVKKGYTVIDSGSKFKLPKYKPLSIETHETNRTLGKLTRNGSSPYHEFQRYKVGDLPDLNSMRSSKYQGRSSSSSIMRDGFKFDSIVPRTPSYSPLQLNNSHMLPINRPMPNVKGVILNTSAKIEGDGSALHTGNVSLVFQNSAGVIDFMKLQRFSTALWATYLSVEGPGISIDPINKKSLKPGEKHRVRYIGQVHNTELGKVMRETDYLMKRWSIGTHRPDISNFLTKDDIYRKLAKKMVTNRASRFWFIPDGLTFKRSSNMLMFAGGRMTLQTEYLDDNPKGEKNEANELFAQWFTENYNLVSERYPIFKDLFEYAQLVSLSTYLRENRVPMLWFLMSNREMILTEDSVAEVDQLVKRSGYEWAVRAYGGVVLKLNEVIRDENSYQDDQDLQDAENMIKAKSQDKEERNSPVIFNANGTSYTVASKNTLKLFNTQAEGDTIQTDLALVDKYHEGESGGNAADKKEWNLIAPRLELVRYYSPGLQTRAQFGDGWHLLVPFRLETETQTSLPDASIIPKRVVMVNLLSGMREVLRLKGRSGKTLIYTPEESGGLTKYLVRATDGSWDLQDILGAKFVFDQEGDLKQMTLRKDRTVNFKLKSKKYSKRIPGYTVKYYYSFQEINGQEKKVLTSISQGEHTARVDWSPSNNMTQIVAIRVLRKGQIGPIEVLSYEYGHDGMLAQVVSKSGRNVLVKYEDNNMRVVALSK